MFLYITDLSYLKLKKCYLLLFSALLIIGIFINTASSAQAVTTGACTGNLRPYINNQLGVGFQIPAGISDAAINPHPNKVSFHLFFGDLYNMFITLDVGNTNYKSLEDYTAYATNKLVRSPVLVDVRPLEQIQTLSQPPIVFNGAHFVYPHGLLNLVNSEMFEYWTVSNNKVYSFVFDAGDLYGQKDFIPLVKDCYDEFKYHMLPSFQLISPTVSPQPSGGVTNPCSAFPGTVLGPNGQCGPPNTPQFPSPVSPQPHF